MKPSRATGKDKTKKEFDELLLEARRVTRVTTWGRRMSFRATVLVGNKKGKIGVGLAKGPDVSTAVKKATNEAYKNIVLVPIAKNNTVPYPLTAKFKSCLIKLIPASVGTGLKAGSSVRAVLELAGYENILSKIVGSNNKLNNALTTVKWLSQYKHAAHFAGMNPRKEEVKEEDNEEDTTNDEVVVKTPEGKIVNNPKKVEVVAEAKKEVAPEAKKEETKPAVKKVVAKKTTKKE